MLFPPSAATHHLRAGGSYETAFAIRSYVYNQNGRLIRAAEGATTLGEYTYDAYGQRATKTAGGVTTVFHFDQQGQLIAETLANGSLVAEYINLESQPLAKAQGTALTYIHTDHLGTPLAMTNVGGAKVWEIEARPFGDAATINGTATLNLRFPGQYFDVELSTADNYFRIYAPNTGRYLQSDPLRQVKWSAGAYVGSAVQASRDINLYTYATNRPINLTDPVGLLSLPPKSCGKILLQYIKCADTGLECKKNLPEVKDPEDLLNYPYASNRNFKIIYEAIDAIIGNVIQFSLCPGILRSRHTSAPVACI
jgi:RHS repeat-associated protein